MAITNIEPKTSKISGGVFIDVTGTDFVQTPYELIPTTSNVTDTSTVSSSLEDKVSGLSLQMPESTGERASFAISQLLPEAFKLKAEIGLMPLSLPLINNAILIGLELKYASNPSKKIRYYIKYDQTQGYQIVLEEKLGTSIIYRKEQFIDPESISSIGLHACGKYIHGFLNINDHEVYFLQSESITSDDYNLEIFSESPSSGVALNSEVIIKSIKGMEAISFCGYPCAIINFTDTEVKFRTTPGEISIGDVIIMSANFTNSYAIGEIKYVFSNGIAKIVKSFDTIQAIYGQWVEPAREELFKNQDGFQWDENYFLSERTKNKELAVPSLWDPTTGNIPKDFFQSGVGPYKALELMEIEKVISNDIEAWYPKIHHGTYFIQNIPFYLFSDQSVIEYLSEEKTTDGRSVHNLLFRPKIGVPVSIYSMTEDRETKVTTQKRILAKRGSFSGKVVNGIELDTINPDNIDTTKEEFIVKINNNNEIKNWIIPIPSTPMTGVYKFNLPKVPLSEFNVIFSRKDIFRTQKTKAYRYGEGIYSNITYGDGIEDLGDYTVDYETGEVEVNLEYLYQDFGVVSFTHEYPAVIEFNQDFTSDRGSAITSPTFSDLSILDQVGYSTGKPSQTFRLSDFPVVDNSTISVPDNTNFRIFIYDEYDNSFDGSWIRVLDLSDYGPNDKVYQFDYANGLIKFGNNIHGKVPRKYLKILAGYKPTMQIQFEPESSNDYWIAKTTDLNLTKQNLSSGFLYLNRKNFVPSQIVAEFASREINIFETSEVSAVVYTQDGEAIPNVKVNFELVNGGGKLRDTQLITNPNGYVSTIYTPSSRLEDMGIRVDLFGAGPDTETPGPQLNSYGTKNGVPYLALKSNEPINGDLNEMLVFKILDDGDDFLPYNNQTRKGGRLVLLYNEVPEPVRGEYIAGSIMGFSQQLPQPFDPSGPNYEPNLRGFYIVGKKTIQARAYVDLEDNRVYSNIVNLITEYSSIQMGTWTLPVPPLNYEHSQINTATYIDINV